MFLVLQTHVLSETWLLVDIRLTMAHFQTKSKSKKTVYFKISDHSALWRRFVVLQTYVVKHGCARSVGGSFLKGGETTTAVS